jgi:hypothetical protein
VRKCASNVAARGGRLKARARPLSLTASTAKARGPLRVAIVGEVAWPCALNLCIAIWRAPEHMRVHTTPYPQPCALCPAPYALRPTPSAHPPPTPSPCYPLRQRACRHVHGAHTPSKGRGCGGGCN